MNNELIEWALAVVGTSNYAYSGGGGLLDVSDALNSDHYACFLL